MSIRPYLRMTTFVLIAVLTGVTALVILCNYLILNASKSALYSSIDNIPYNRVGLLLGTSKYAKLGGYNDHYRLRVKAAVDLFAADKIDYILISGDNSTRYYDEPSTIRRDLLSMGIPSDRIYRDYAGFRTLDSVIRANRVFGQPEFTIISQATHNLRAIYIAHNRNINAIAFNAGNGQDTDWNNRVREILARVLAVVEIHMLDTEPKYLGPVVDIGVSPPT